MMQAKDYQLKHYPTIGHDDGLETAILGLDMQLQRLTFNGDGMLSANPNNDPNTKLLKLQCRSEVVSINLDTDTTQTHHQKSTVHTSQGHLYQSGERGRP